LGGVSANIPDIIEVYDCDEARQLQRQGAFTLSVTLDSGEVVDENDTGFVFEDI
jgi:hypothetical protein